MEFLVLTKICSVLSTDLTQLNLDASFTNNGGHSLSAVALASSCLECGYPLSYEDIFRSKTLRDVLKKVQTGTVSTPCIQLQGQEASLKSDGLLVGAQSLESTASLSIGIKKSEEVQVVTEEISYPYEPQPVQSFSLGAIPLSITLTTKSSTPSSTCSPSSDFDDESVTEMQLSLIHGTLRNPEVNMIKYTETIDSDQVSGVKSAWKQVMETEPIFANPTLRKLLGDEGELFSWTDPATPEGSISDDETDMSAKFKGS